MFGFGSLLKLMSNGKQSPENDRLVLNSDGSEVAQHVATVNPYIGGEEGGKEEEEVEEETSEWTEMKLGELSRDVVLILRTKSKKLATRQLADIDAREIVLIPRRGEICSFMDKRNVSISAQMAHIWHISCLVCRVYQSSISDGFDGFMTGFS